MKIILRRVIEQIHIIEHDFLVGITADEAQRALEVAQDAILEGAHKKAVSVLTQVTGTLANNLHAQLSAYDGCPSVEGETRTEEEL
jgi:hypothetical protein